jgi:hypothetical protein
MLRLPLCLTGWQGEASDPIEPQPGIQQFGLEGRAGMPQYKLRMATAALCQGAGGPIAMTIPLGSILKVTDESADASGLVEAEWDGRSVRIFSVDLRSHGELLKVRSA